MRLSFWRGAPAMETHVHTTYSDGTGTLDECVRQASALGLARLCLTDHVDHTTSWYDAFVADVRRARADHGGALEIVTGLEVRVADFAGSLNAPDALLDKADVVVGVVHSLPTVEGGKVPRDGLTPVEGLRIERAALESLTINPRVDIVGHIGGTSRRFFGDVPLPWMEDAVRITAEAGKAVEVSWTYHRECFLRMLAWCERYGATVAFGSDAHRPEHIGRSAALARECGAW